MLERILKGVVLICNDNLMLLPPLNPSRNTWIDAKTTGDVRSPPFDTFVRQYRNERLNLCFQQWHGNIEMSLFVVLPATCNADVGGFMMSCGLEPMSRGVGG